MMDKKGVRRQTVLPKLCFPFAAVCQDKPEAHVPLYSTYDHFVHKQREKYRVKIHFLTLSLKQPHVEFNLPSPVFLVLLLGFSFFDFAD